MDDLLYTVENSARGDLPRTVTLNLDLLMNYEKRL
jgi:hypothetical protein